MIYYRLIALLVVLALMLNSSVSASNVEWYRKAADQGDADAQYNLGLMYEEGRGVAKDEQKAVEWFRQAADQGYAAAQFNLGLMYAIGQGVERDEKKVIKWYKAAAEQGHIKAQFALGVRYKDGRGVAKDEATAVAWYRKAADQGHADAQFLVGVMYEDGRGVDKDKKEALEWYRKASEQGHKKAQAKLKALEQESVKRKYDSFSSKMEVDVPSSLNIRPADRSSPVRQEEMGKKSNPSPFKPSIVTSSAEAHEEEIKHPIKKRKEEGESLESLLLKKKTINSNVKKNKSDYANQYELASLYEKISSLCSLPELKSQYLLKAINGYKGATEYDHQGAQKALKRLRDKGAYSSLDEETMVWHKKAVTQAGLNFDEFMHITLNPAYPLKLSSISFINLEDERSFPATVEWGGSRDPHKLNHIYAPLYIPNRYGRYEDAIMAIDPSGDGEDETAYCVAKRYGDLYFITALGGFAGGYEEKEKLRVGNSPDVVAKIADIAMAHKVHYVLIEKNNDNSYARLLKEKLKEDIEVIKWHHSQKKEKRIIESLQPIMDAHQLIIDRSVLKEDFESHPTQDLSYKFFYQLTHMTLDEKLWANKKSALVHDDRLDAAAMAIKHLRVRKEKLKDPEYQELQ